MTWPYLTSLELHITGEFKSSEKDFLVEEIPTYLPSGSGEHLYLFLEKTGLTTDQVIRKLAQALAIKPKAIGFAGKKDRKAVTRQWLSLQHVSPERVQRAEIPGVTILEMAYHKNKLRPGHLKGNRFTIRLKNVSRNQIPVLEQIVKDIETRGVPNYFGPQRFGVKGDNPAVGLALLQRDWASVFQLILGSPQETESSVQVYQARKFYEHGDFKKALELWPKEFYFARTALWHLIENNGNFEKTVKELPKKQVKFFLNSLQSYWFNCCLRARVQAIDQLWSGDLAYLHRNGAVFRVKDEKQEQARADQFEISPSGPLFGAKMIAPEGRELDLERSVLMETFEQPEELQPAFRHWLLEGGRRAYRVPLRNFNYSVQQNDLELKFDLDAGSYATAVIREMLKHHFIEPPIKLANVE